MTPAGRILLRWSVPLLIPEVGANLVAKPQPRLLDSFKRSAQRGRDLMGVLLTALCHVAEIGEDRCYMLSPAGIPICKRAFDAR